MKTFVCAFTVLGEPASAKNQRRLVRIGGKPAFIKSAKALSYVNTVRLQVRALHPLLTCNICLNMHMFYGSRRPDLSGDDALLDALENRIYLNDRQIKEKHLYWHLDTKNPRAEIEVFSLDDGYGEA